MTTDLVDYVEFCQGHRDVPNACLCSNTHLLMATLVQYLLYSVLVFILYRWVQFHLTKSKVSASSDVEGGVLLKILAQIDSIPTLGSNNFIGAYIDGWKYLFRGHELVKEGYKKVWH